MVLPFFTMWCDLAMVFRKFDLAHWRNSRLKQVSTQLSSSSQCVSLQSGTRLWFSGQW